MVNHENIPNMNQIQRWIWSKEKSKDESKNKSKDKFEHEYFFSDSCLDFFSWLTIVRYSALKARACLISCCSCLWMERRAEFLMNAGGWSHDQVSQNHYFFSSWTEFKMVVSIISWTAPDISCWTHESGMKNALQFTFSTTRTSQQYLIWLVKH